MPTFFDLIAFTLLEIMVGISSLFPWFKKRNEKGKRRLRDLTFAGTIGIAIIISFPVFFLVFILYLHIFAPKYGDITKRKFGEIETHIKAYTEKNVTPPISLSTFIEMRPLRSSWTKDEWGNTIHYIIDNKTGGVKLHSPGKDNVFGTTDDIITNVNHQ